MFARPEDLLALAGQGGRPFEEFLFDLVQMEASRHGIPPHAVRWDPRTSVPDGGRDIFVDATHADPSPRFVPQRHSIWSAKSGKDGLQPSTLRGEIIDPGHGALRQHLRDGNVFVWCALQPADADGQAALRDKAAEVAPTTEGGPFDPALVQFRWLADLCAVLNDHPGLIAKHLPDVDRRFAGIQTLAEWGQGAAGGLPAVWADIPARREAADAVRAHLRGRSGQNVLHVAGLSGVGKTRTVLEACRGERDLGGVLYVPRHEGLSEAFLRHLTRNEHLVALVVVDEVPIGGVREIAAAVGGHAGRLRFVTIGPARRGERGRPGANVLVLAEPDTEEGVLPVVRLAGPGLSPPVSRSIARFAAHDLRLALMLVEATQGDDRLRDIPIEDGAEVWERVTRLFAARLGDVAAFRANYPWLTVAVDVGVREDLREELDFVGGAFNVAPERLDDAVGSATPCGLGVDTPRMFEPTPRGLAGHLFRQRVWPSLRNRLEVLGEAPERLLRRFLERCQECDEEDRGDIEGRLSAFFWAALGDPRLAALIDRGRSRLFKAWAELDPGSGLPWLRQAVASATDDDLAAFTGDTDGSGGWRGRRQVVWLCEALAQFDAHFASCEEVLFRLAQVETEPRIGNNSTGIWRGLFSPALAFTEVPFPERADMLLRRLGEADERTLRLALSAVVDAIGWQGGRMLPPQVVGGRLVPERWLPASHGEIARLQAGLAARTLEAVAALPAPLAGIGREAVVKDLGAFAHLGLVGQLKDFLPADGGWGLALRAQLRRLIRGATAAAKARPGGAPEPHLNGLREWYAALEPAGLADRARDLTMLAPWEAAVDAGGEMRPRPQAPYQALAGELLACPDALAELDGWFDGGQARSAFHLGLALGEADAGGDATPVVGPWLDAARCGGVVGGHLRGVARREGALPAEWGRRLDEAAARHPMYAALMTAEADFSRQGLGRITGLVASGSAPVTALEPLVYPEWGPVLGVDERAEVIRLLRLEGSRREQAVGVALALTTAWTRHGEEAIPEALAASAIESLREGLGLDLDSYNWATTAKALAMSAPQEAAGLLAEALTTPGPMRFELRDEAHTQLLCLAGQHSRHVMEAFGRALLDPARRPHLGLSRLHGLLEAIGLPEVRSWLGEHGTGPVRGIAHHLDSPRLQSGVPSVPPVTGWVMGQFGGDDRIFRAFCAGRHCLEIRAGDAIDRRPELEREVGPFLGQEGWVRRWARYEFDVNDDEARWDERTDEQMERM